MKKHDNIRLFLSSNIDENINSFLNHINDNLINEYNLNGKIIKYKRLSDFNIGVDKKTLLSEDRHKNYLSRLCKLLFTMDLRNSRLVLCNSYIPLFPIIIYSLNDEEMVIDYKNNLVMKKEDYFDIFKIEVLNEVDKLDLYKIFQIIDYIDDIYYYLLFSKEILKDLSRNFEFINETYDENGINKSIYMLFDDCIFFQAEDYLDKNMDIINKIDEFTLGNTYNGSSYEINGYSFYILSDYIGSKKMCNVLKSRERYGECHANSIKLSFYLKHIGENDIYIVGGKMKANEVDYIYHSWVEIPSKNVAIDFNRNIIMNIDDYYRLCSSVSINKTHIDEMNDILDTLNDFKFYPSIINYFGNDLIKNIIKSKIKF